MNSLGPRKQLLLMEAEVCRRLLAADWEAAQAGLLAGAKQVRSFGSLASLAGVGWAAIKLIRQRKAHGGRMGLLFRGLRLAVMAWPAIKVMRARE